MQQEFSFFTLSQLLSILVTELLTTNVVIIKEEIHVNAMRYELTAVCGLLHRPY